MDLKSPIDSQPKKTSKTIVDWNFPELLYNMTILLSQPTILLSQPIQLALFTGYLNTKLEKLMLIKPNVAVFKFSARGENIRTASYAFFAARLRRSVIEF